MRVFDTEVYEVDEHDIKSFRSFSWVVAITATVLFFTISLSLVFFLASKTEVMADKGHQMFSIVFVCFASKALFHFCRDWLESYLLRKLEALPDLGA